MDHPGGTCFTALHSDADIARRLQDENPFFQARAERYDRLDAALRQFDPADTRPSTRRYKDFLKRRRDLLLEEMVQLVEATRSRPPPDVAPSRKSTPRKDWIWL